jgi:hypothetical protein
MQKLEVLSQHLDLLVTQTHLSDFWLVLAEYWELLFSYHLLHFLGQIDIVVSVGAKDLTRLVVSLVDTFLAVLEVEPHVVLPEVCL